MKSVFGISDRMEDLGKRPSEDHFGKASNLESVYLARKR